MRTDRLRDQPPSAKVFWFWLGLMTFGAIGFVGMINRDIPGTEVWHIAVVMVVVTGALAFLAFAKEQVSLGSGILIGYMVATLFSGGECTLWSSGPLTGGVPPGVELRSAGAASLGGFIIYFLLLVVVLITAAGALAYEWFTRPREPSDR